MTHDLRHDLSKGAIVILFEDLINKSSTINDINITPKDKDFFGYVFYHFTNIVFYEIITNN
jgi:hypothetical protein